MFFVSNSKHKKKKKSGLKFILLIFHLTRLRCFIYFLSDAALISCQFGISVVCRNVATFSLQSSSDTLPLSQEPVLPIFLQPGTVLA